MFLHSRSLWQSTTGEPSVERCSFIHTISCSSTALLGTSCWILDRGQQKRKMRRWTNTSIIPSSGMKNIKYYGYHSWQTGKRDEVETPQLSMLRQLTGSVGHLHVVPMETVAQEQAGALAVQHSREDGVQLQHACVYTPQPEPNGPEDSTGCGGSEPGARWRNRKWLHSLRSTIVELLISSIIKYLVASLSAIGGRMTAQFFIWSVDSLGHVMHLEHFRSSACVRCR